MTGYVMPLTWSVRRYLYLRGNCVRQDTLRQLLANNPVAFARLHVLELVDPPLTLDNPEWAGVWTALLAPVSSTLRELRIDWPSLEDQQNMDSLFEFVTTLPKLEYLCIDSEHGELGPPAYMGEAAQRLLAEHGVRLETWSGTGSTGGRV